MFAKKLTKHEREALRAQRRETQLITARARADKSFIYVVNPPEIPRVAFGSCMERITLPISGPGLSSFMRKIQGEVRDFPGPFEYVHSKEALDKKYPSAYGYSSFASKLPRLPPTDISRFPPIGAYNVEPKKKIKQAARPFNIGTKRVQIKKLVTPCPADYAADQPRASLNICSAFGSRRIIWPAVAVICTPVNIAKCSKCNKTPVGDYFHQFQLNLDMCRRCMNKQLKMLKRCSTDLFYRARMRTELSLYRPVRYCDFFHDHQGTTAAIQHMPTSTLRYKIKTENYIYMFKKR
ncbi:uncharacterized protein LOC105226654 isoform X1 [Bactrocera dorsalis]|uniref:Uncharacterized protein LOC105226654 isoform X1 n=1 Tax=Bactrocera dorsalis TaxID=27457 RepID=A0A8N4L5P9_BACDO|nr:uncharacterized protein LOC105226654 isoform X1 [Bactrocera dorsalis]